jgi:hypothetical protein
MGVSRKADSERGHPVRLSAQREHFLPKPILQAKDLRGLRPLADRMSALRNFFGKNGTFGASPDRKEVGIVHGLIVRESSLPI